VFLKKPFSEFGYQTTQPRPQPRPRRNEIQHNHQINIIINIIQSYHTAINIQQKQASIAMGVVSIFVLFYLLSGIFWWTLFSSGFLILAHAMFRDASLHKDAEDRVDMSGDLTLPSGGSEEDSAFLSSDKVENI
jgi:hypothetical protein